MEDIFHLGIKAILRNDKGEILLLQVNPAKLKNEQPAYWDLPGGRVQRGDTVIDTLRREVEEETGITGLRDPQEVGMVLANIRIPLSESESAGLILRIYTCDIPPNAAMAISDEHLAFQWIAPVKAAELLKVKYPAEFRAIVRSL